MKKTQYKADLGKFLSQQQWQIFGTTTYHSNFSSNTNRKLMEKTFNELNEVSQMFFVSETFDQSSNVHAHFLIKSDRPDATIKSLKKKFNYYGRNAIELVQYTPENLTDEGTLKLGYYVTKNVSSGADFDYLVK